MNHHRLSGAQSARLGFLLLLVAFGGCGGGGGEELEALVVTELVPGDGIEAFQVSFWHPQEPAEHTTWGRLRVSPEKLEKETGVRGGWLNVATEHGWVVVNLPMPPVEDGPFSVYFDLGLDAPEPLQQIALHAKLTNRGFGAIADHMTKAALFPIEFIDVDARGWGPETDPEPEDAPHLLPLLAEVRVPFDVTAWSQQLTNEQCAQDQCAPMAASNALQYLEDMSVWTLTHAHDLGLGGDATLVGQLDTLTGRWFASRAVGNGIGADELVDGVFEYISDNGLTGILTHRHQDQGWGSDLPAADYTLHGSTSQYDGAMPTWTWIRDRLSDGCGIVAGYSHSAGGGHMVRVTGAMLDSAGGEWLRYTHDALQTGADATDTQGLESVWVEVSDVDGDGIPNLGAGGSELRFVFASCP